MWLSVIILTIVNYHNLMKRKVISAKTVNHRLYELKNE